MTGNKEPSRPEGAEGLEEILALLREITAAIMRLPEAQAAAFFQQKEEYEAAQFQDLFQDLRASDIGNERVEMDQSPQENYIPWDKGHSSGKE